MMDICDSGYSSLSQSPTDGAASNPKKDSSNPPSPPKQQQAQKLEELVTMNEQDSDVEQWQCKSGEFLSSRPRLVSVERRTREEKFKEVRDYAAVNCTLEQLTDLHNWLLGEPENYSEILEIEAKLKFEWAYIMRELKISSIKEKEHILKMCPWLTENPELENLLVEASIISS